jgi:Fur family ferric uptake transcriptional regulator
MPDTLLRQYLSDKKLKLTPQRILILEAFLEHGDHVSSEELYDLVKSRNRAIGQATVYRTLKLLAEARIADEVVFGDGIVRYERRDRHAHHDHIVCERCHQQLEFHDPVIEDLQVRQAEKHGFTLTSHRMVLFGICPDCKI